LATGSTFCYFCPKGTHAPRPGGASEAVCAACPSDTYAPEAGSPFCKGCPSGEDTGGETGASSCAATPSPWWKFWNWGGITSDDDVVDEFEETLEAYHEKESATARPTPSPSGAATTLRKRHENSQAGKTDKGLVTALQMEVELTLCGADCGAFEDDHRVMINSNGRFRSAGERALAFALGKEVLGLVPGTTAHSTSFTSVLSADETKYEMGRQNSRDHLRPWSRKPFEHVCDVGVKVFAQVLCRRSPFLREACEPGMF